MEGELLHEVGWTRIDFFLFFKEAGALAKSEADIGRAVESGSGGLIY